MKKKRENSKIKIVVIDNRLSLANFYPSIFANLTKALDKRINLTVFPKFRGVREISSEIVILNPATLRENGFSFVEEARSLQPDFTLGIIAHTALETVECKAQIQRLGLNACLFESMNVSILFHQLKIFLSDYFV